MVESDRPVNPNDGERDPGNPNVPVRDKNYKECNRCGRKFLGYRCPACGYARERPF